MTEFKIQSLMDVARRKRLPVTATNFFNCVGGGHLSPAITHHIHEDHRER
jgi:hypothetical protein